ncbi:hypothetical protein BB560_001438 [Smittium megazygosporum]|uniref:TPR-like protein n=1 Tax=Smittium megazygosporum TaxID=133381 RepID=A0A2T9ZHL4_9FUNG|nr:hypothetical protein BB560_001438 [Smittium megazygosporum]
MTGSQEQSPEDKPAVKPTRRIRRPRYNELNQPEIQQFTHVSKLFDFSNITPPLIQAPSIPAAPLPTFRAGPSSKHISGLDLGSPTNGFQFPGNIPTNRRLSFRLHTPAKNKVSPVSTVSPGSTNMDIAQGIHNSRDKGISGIYHERSYVHISPMINPRDIYVPSIENTFKKPRPKKLKKLENYTPIQNIKRLNKRDSPPLHNISPSFPDSISSSSLSYPASVQITNEITGSDANKQANKNTNTPDFLGQSKKCKSPNLLKDISIDFPETNAFNNSSPHLVNQKFISETDHTILIKTIRLQAKQRLYENAFKSALFYYKLSYLFSNQEPDLLHIIEILVQLGDYGQADNLLFSNSIKLEHPPSELKLRLVKLGIVISNRLNKMNRIGYLNQIVETYEDRDPCSKKSINSLYINNDTESSVSDLERGVHPENQFPKKLKPEACPKSNILSESSESENLNLPNKRTKIESKVAGLPKKQDELNLSINIKNTRKAWRWFMCGLSILQSKKTFGWENQIAYLQKKYSLFRSSSSDPSVSNFVTPSQSQHSSSSFIIDGSDLDKEVLPQIVKYAWVEAILSDPLCIEAWSSIRNHGLLSVFEELSLISTIKWAEFCGGNQYTSTFFRSFIILFSSPFFINSFVMDAYNTLISDYSRIRTFSEFRILCAERFLTNDYVRLATHSLEFESKGSSQVYDPYSSVSNGSTASQLTGWVKTKKSALIYAKAQYLIDFFGFSSLLKNKKRTRNSLPSDDSDDSEYPMTRLYKKKKSRLESFSIDSTDRIWKILSNKYSSEEREVLPSAAKRIRALESSSSSLRTGLSNVLLGSEPLKLENNIDNISSHTTHMCGFKMCDGLKGEALCYFAIGAYYLSLFPMKIDLDYDSDSEVEISYKLKSQFKRKNVRNVMKKDKNIIEARKWFSKTTMLAPLSPLAWMSLAYSFYAAKDLNRAIEAAKSAVVASSPLEFSLGTDHNGGKSLFNRTISEITSLSNYGRNAYLPLLSLGTIFIQNKNFSNSIKCLAAAMQSLFGMNITEAYETCILPFFDAVKSDHKHNNPSNFFSLSEFPELTVKSQHDSVIPGQISLFDPVLLNEIGVSKLNLENHKEAIVWISAALFCISKQPRNEKTDSHKATFCTNLAQCFKTAKSYKLAIKYSKMALEFDSHNVEALISLAYLYYYVFLTGDSNEDSEVDNLDLFESSLVEIPDPGKYLGECIDLCHNALHFDPYNTIAAELLEMALEDCTETQNLMSFEASNSSASTVLGIYPDSKLKAFDDYIDKLLEEEKFNESKKRDNLFKSTHSFDHEKDTSVQKKSAFEATESHDSNPIRDSTTRFNTQENSNPFGLDNRISALGSDIESD